VHIEAREPESFFWEKSQLSVFTWFYNTKTEETPETRCDDSRNHILSQWIKENLSPWTHRKKLDASCITTSGFSRIKMDANLTLPHRHEFIMLWVQPERFHLHDHTDDTIVWNLMSNGEYSPTLAYNVQFSESRLRVSTRWFGKLERPRLNSSLG
jgi:hypothetical protein